MPTAAEKIRTFIDRDIALALLIAIAAWGIGWLIEQTSIVSPGASAIAMFVGLAAAVGSGLEFPGVRVLIAKLLPIAIVMLGFELDFSVIGASIGLAGVVAIAGTVFTSFGGAYVTGRLTGLNTQTSLALGAGGAICGNSAVLAVAPSLRLKTDETALVLAAINLLGLAMFFIVVVFANVLNLDPIAAGIWAGSSVHAVPQAIAAGEALGPQGLAIATAVKLSRVALLVVVVPIFGILGNRLVSEPADGETKPHKVHLPWFVPGFVVAAILGNVLPTPVADGAGYVGRLILLPVLAAVGLTVTRVSLRRSGGRVIVAGVLTTAAFATVSLLAVLVFLK